MIALTPSQEEELRRYGSGKPRHPSVRPNANLVRRNLLTRAPSMGPGWYRITEYGSAALAERKPTPLVGRSFRSDTGGPPMTVVDEDDGFLYLKRSDSSKRVLANPRGGYVLSRGDFSAWTEVW